MLSKTFQFVKKYGKCPYVFPFTSSPPSCPGIPFMMDVCTGVHLIRCNDELLRLNPDDQGLADLPRFTGVSNPRFSDPFFIQEDHGKSGFIEDGIGDLQSPTPEFEIDYEEEMW